MPQWDDFYPFVVNSASRDSDAIEALFERFDASARDMLDKGIRELPPQAEPGLYRLDGFGEGWVAGFREEGDETE